MKYFDQHLHTRFSEDSKEEPENYLIAAKESAVPFFVSTEHLEYNWNNEGTNWFPDFAAQTGLYRDLSEKYPSITIMQGIEIGYKSDKINEINSLLKANGFSLVNLSVHDYMGYDLYFPQVHAKYSPKEILEGNFSKMTEAAASDIDYDVLCHVDYAFKTACSIDKTLRINAYADYLKEIFKTVVARGKALEVNIKVQSSIASREHLEFILNLYRSMGGCLLTLSSDSHRIERYLKDLGYYLDIIKSCGFENLCFFIDKKPTLIAIDELL